MKRTFLRISLLLTVLVAVGCLGDDVDIENNRRLLVKGKITDPQGTPLPNISVITSGLGDEIGRTNTDANGNFKLVSLDEKFDPLDIFINFQNYPNSIDFFSSRAYYSSEHTNRLLYDLGTVILGKLATLNITLKNVDGDQNTVNYELLYTPSFCELPLTEIPSQNNCDLAKGISGTLSPSSETQPLVVFSTQSSKVFFKYSLNDGPTQTIEIPLTNEQNTYVFEY